MGAMDRTSLIHIVAAPHAFGHGIHLSMSGNDEGI